jgi:hypothetical protein
MRKLFILFFPMLVLAYEINAQTDSTKNPQITGIFERISREVQQYKIDTSAVPNDKITRKIIELRELRGGFNINEAVAYKLEEDDKKNETPKATLNLLKESFQTGKGKEWLDNATIHIYREQFSYKELKQLVKFYKTSAGQKMAEVFPYIMLKTLMAAQIIHDALLKQVSS